MRTEWLLIPVISLTLVACNRNTEPNRNVPSDVKADNTGQNVRDRDLNTLTPGDQSETKEDLTITQNIRKALIDDTSLSENGKNIKVITINGRVTLRGVVNSSQEKDAVGSKAKAVAGVTQVDNQLDVKK